MKRWLALLAAALLLSGCSNAAPSGSEDNIQTTLPQFPTLITTSLYDAQNPIEMDTNGAVRAYLPENGDDICIKPMGDNILLYGSGRIMRLRGDRLTEVATAEIPDLPEPDSGMLQIREDGIAYYDARENRIVFLNVLFREVGIFSLPEGIVGSVYLSRDWKAFYYCAEDGIHALDLDTGVNRLLKAQNALWQGISGGFMNGTVLRCSLLQEDGTEMTMLLSAQTGTVLAEGDYLMSLQGDGDCYYVQADNAHIFGILDQQPQKLLPDGKGKLYPLPESRGAVFVTKLEAGYCMDYYDIETGKRTAAVELTNIASIDGVYSAGGMVWFTSGGVLYRWNIKQSETEEQKTYTAAHYHYADPDEQGLAEIGQRLEKIQQQYGVTILFWDQVEGLAPWDYSFAAEYLTQPYTQSIPKLESALAKFPKEFFEEIAKWSGSGKVNIALVRGIYGGAETEKYASASGIQFFANGDAYIALALGEDIETWLCHELGHLLDSRILTTTNAYSQWSSLNPWDFKYDNDYEKNAERTDTKYLEGEKRHFVDFYSMSFAVEDRSRIFEYACMPGNEEVFASKYMQKKLKTVCDGIRKAFSLEDEGYIWEQYLQE